MAKISSAAEHRRGQKPLCSFAVTPLQERAEKHNPAALSTSEMELRESSPFSWHWRSRRVPRPVGSDRQSRHWPGLVHTWSSSAQGAVGAQGPNGAKGRLEEFV